MTRIMKLCMSSRVPFLSDPLILGYPNLGHQTYDPVRSS